IAVAEHESIWAGLLFQELLHVLAAVRLVEQPLGHRIEIFMCDVEQNRADFFADLGASRLLGLDDSAPHLTQTVGCERELRGFARALDAFECDERHRASLARILPERLQPPLRSRGFRGRRAPLAHECSPNRRQRSSTTSSGWGPCGPPCPRRAVAVVALPRL